MRHGVLVASSRNRSNMSAVPSNPRQLQTYSGQWNVQVVRGKVTTRCLWNACKALSIGLLLMAIGTSMAIVGYYADQLSIGSEVRGNSTIRVKNESRGFHLNNLSYAGPIVMGVGGFIVVAACVMTFEARDSAAKVVPARFKPNANSSIQVSSTKSTPHSTKTFQRLDSKRNTGCQTPGSKAPGSYKLANLGQGSGLSPISDPAGRRALTAAFVQFSRALIENSSFENSRRSGRKFSEVTLNKSPSAPNLGLESPSRSHKATPHDGSRKSSKASPRSAHRSHRESIRPLDASGCTLLNPYLLQRQALSMDNPFYDGYGYGCCTPPSPRLSRQHSSRSGGSRESFEMELGASAGVSGSQASMALDLHECQVTLKVKDESQTKRSDTARRHQLLRQKPVEDEKEEKMKCSCIPKRLCTHTVDDIAIRTTFRSTEDSRHASLKIRPKDRSRSEHSSKHMSDFRHRSFSQSRSSNEERRASPVHDCDRKRRFPSCERIKKSPEEKAPFSRRFSVQNRWSPDRSLSRSSECRIHEHDSMECMVHGRDPILNHTLVRKNAKRRKSTQKEGSLSTEENRNQQRSFSRSPTERAHYFRSPGGNSFTSPTKRDCCRSPARGSPINGPTGEDLPPLKRDARPSSRKCSPVPSVNFEETDPTSPKVEEIKSTPADALRLEGHLETDTFLPDDPS